MARTAIHVTPFPGAASVADPAGTAIDQANGHVLAAGNQPQRFALRVANSAGAAKNLIVRAGGNPPALNAGKGDLTIAVANGVTVFVGPLDGDRFAQADGSMNVDMEAGFTGTIEAFQWPTQFA